MDQVDHPGPPLRSSQYHELIYQYHESNNIQHINDTPGQFWF